MDPPLLTLHTVFENSFCSGGSSSWQWEGSYTHSYRGALHLHSMLNENTHMHESLSYSCVQSGFLVYTLMKCGLGVRFIGKAMWVSGPNFVTDVA